jgi:hypothetical protein
MPISKGWLTTPRRTCRATLPGPTLPAARDRAHSMAMIPTD